MEVEQFSADVFPLPQTRRTTLFFIQNLLLFLSLNIYAAPNPAITQQKLTSINQTPSLPIPISNTSMFINLAAITAPTVVTERIVVSSAVTAVSVAERRQHVAWYAESHTNRGIRYRSGSESIENGFDCSGFVHYVMTYFDIKTKRSSSDMYNEGIHVPVVLAQKGDLVFFGSKNDISHVAMVVSNDEKGLVVIHSCSRGIMKENITESAYWKPKLKDKAVNIIGF